MLLMPALANTAESQTQISSRSMGSAMHHCPIPQQFRDDVIASNLEIHKSVDGQPVSHFVFPPHDRPIPGRLRRRR
jgi:hypothetical protein